MNQFNIVEAKGFRRLGFELDEVALIETLPRIAAPLSIACWSRR